jgi:hypothetical protein
MKRTSHLLVVMIAATMASAGSAQAQWSMNGNKIFYSDGKVGIGTQNPNSPLQVVSDIGATDRPTLLVKMTNTLPQALNAAIRGINRGTGGFGIGVWGSHDGAGYGVYGTAGADGYAVIGQAGTDGTGVYGSSTGADGYGGYFAGRGFFSNDVGLGVDDPLFQLHLSTNSAAKPTSNTWTISSDRRLKKNINPIHGALQSMMSLRGVTYQWKNPETQGDMTGTYTGMIAQDVEQVFPEWVRDDTNGYKTLTVIGFEGIVVEALRELRAEKDAEIAELDLKNDMQGDQIESLTTRVAELERFVSTLIETRGAE